MSEQKEELTAQAFLKKKHRLILSLSNQAGVIAIFSERDVIECMEEFAALRDKEIERLRGTEKEFAVQRLINGNGRSHLVVITEPAIEDVHIGTVLIVPYSDGFKDPVSVLLQVDSDGLPKTVNERFAVVSKYIYESPPTPGEKT